MLSGNFAEMTTSTQFRDLFHAANLRHGTDGFSSPPKEGVLRIFSPLKIRRLRPGLNPRTWVLKASTLPLDHMNLRIRRSPSSTFLPSLQLQTLADPKLLFAPFRMLNQISTHPPKKVVLLQLLHCSFRVFLYIKDLVTPTNAQLKSYT